MPTLSPSEIDKQLTQRRLDVESLERDKDNLQNQINQLKLQIADISTTTTAPAAPDSQFTTVQSIFKNFVKFLSNVYITAIAAGQVLFGGTGGLLSGSNNLFWDNTNGALGVGTASPDPGFGANFNTICANNSGGSGGGILRAKGSSVINELYANDAVPAGIFGTRSNHTLQFRTNNTNQMELDTSGNLNLKVGVFEANGSAGVAGALTISLSTSTIQYKDWTSTNQSITVVTNVTLTTNNFSKGIRIT